MVRKLVSALSIFAFTVLNVGQTSPAQAWPDFTVSPTVSFLDIGGAWAVPVGKTIASDSVFVYAEEPRDSGPRYLRSYTVSPTGAITGPVTITTNSDEANYQVTPQSVWVDSTGTFNVIYWSWRSASAGLESMLYQATSKDGLAWTTPTVLDSFLGSSAECQQTWCGIRGAQVALSPLGTVAVSYVVTEGAAGNKLYFRTKPLGKAWSAKGVLDTSTTLQLNITMKSIGKGWIAAWGSWGNQVTMYSAFSTGDKLTTWTAPQQRGVSPCTLPLNFLQISPTKVGLIYLTGCEEGSSTQTYRYQAFNLGTKQFGSAADLDSVPNTGQPYTYVTDYLAGQSAFGYSVYTASQSDTGYAKYILFRNGTPSVQYVAQNSVTSGEMQAITGMSLDSLGHLTVVWTTTAGGTVALKISQIYRGTRADINAPINHVNSGDYAVIFSPDGDIYISHVGGSAINAIERIRSDAPDLAGSVKVSGKAAVNKSLTVKLPSITATQLFQAWKTSYQWLSCSLQVTESTSISPTSCSELAGATAASYKVKAADKNRYLLVKLTVKSDNSSQIQYSASTQVVK